MNDRHPCGPEIRELLNDLRNTKDFRALKCIRDYLQFLISVNNKDWFEDSDVN